MELNRNPENYFADVEQAAFNPANVVPGIGFSPDQMLQGAAVLLRRRAALPPRRQPPPDPGERAAVPGATATTATAPCGSTATTAARCGYRAEQLRRVAGAAGVRASPAQAVGAAADRWNYREDDDDYFSSPAILFRRDDRRAAAGALREHRPRDRRAPPKDTIERHIANCTKADPAYGEGVAQGHRGPAGRQDLRGGCEHRLGVMPLA